VERERRPIARPQKWSYEARGEVRVWLWA